jgi:soluble lytic murein transglycosylase
MKSWRHWVWIVSIAACLVGYWRYRWRLEHSQDSVIKAASQRYGVETALVKAIVWRESHFNQNAQGHAGEIGLMQLQEKAAQEWAQAEGIPNFQHGHCFNPRTNTLAGTWYLKKLLGRYRSTDNAVPYALADYNAGRRNVLKWLNGAATTNSALFIEEIQFPMTKDYVRAVIRREQYYQKLGRSSDQARSKKEGI